jgi:hypothetical protein
MNIEQELREIRREVREAREAARQALQKTEEILALLRRPQPKSISVKFGTPIQTEATEMSSPGFNAPNVDDVPYVIAVTNADGSAYALQAGDALALTSTDGHSEVTQNPNDPTGATGTVSDEANFVGPVSGALSFMPGPAAVAQGIQPVLGTWTGTWDAVAQQLAIAVTFGTPAAPPTQNPASKPAAGKSSLPAPHKT